jgi:predicted PurR-regulated permease PerM
MTPGTQADIVRTMLAVLFISLLIGVTFYIMEPFLIALIWATMIVVTTWPMMLGIQHRLFNKRWIANTIMTLLLLLVLIVPLTLSIVSIIDHSDDIAAWAKGLGSMSLPPAPRWLTDIPLVGPKLATRWQQFALLGQAEVAARLAPHAKTLMHWLLQRAGSLGMMLVQFVLTAIISAVLYGTGEKAATGVLRFAKKLSGHYGEDAVIIAGKSIRGVALGVVVTALVQAILAGLGLWVSGVPAPLILTGVAFVLCIAQVGPGLVLIPAIIWLYYNDQTLWGSIMIPWAILCGTIDNFIRPILIKKGADLPLLLIFAGVIGGLIAFGVVGLFIGPVMLAVTYNLLGAWVNMVEPEPELEHPGGSGHDISAPGIEPGPVLPREER